MHKLLAITRYELLMQWRRGGILTVMVLLCIVGIGLVAFMRSSMDPSRIPPLAAARTQEELVTMFLLGPLQLSLSVVMVALPLIASESVPIDHQTRVIGLLHSLPLPRWMYLLGKLLGVLILVVLGMALSGLIVCAVIWVLFGNYNVLAVLTVWCVVNLPLALLAGASGLLIGSTQPGRRRALLLALPSGVYFYAYLITRAGGLMPIAETLLPDVSLSRSSLVNLTGMPTELIVLEMLAIVGGLFGVAWLWQCWREER